MSRLKAPRRRPSVALALHESLERRLLFVAELIKDINPVLTSLSSPVEMADAGGTLYFSLFGRIWKTDGTPGDAGQIVPDILNPSQLCNLNGTLFFNGLGALWKSDGTMGGTARIGNVFMNPRSIIAVGDQVFFRGTDGGGEELWVSDGTAAGTGRVKDINPGSAGSEPRELVDVNGTLFFRARDADGGDELWKSDGSAAGTVPVKDIVPGAAGSDPVALTNVNGTLFFVAHDAVDQGFELWKSDGSAAGTVRVKDIRPGKPGSSPTFLRNVGGTLMFVATDGQSGYELWKSDGSEAGTVMVKDIVAGGGSAMIDQLCVVGSTLFFSADDGLGAGIELWKSDGTAAGTVRVKDINPGFNGSNPGVMTAVGNKLFFMASGGGPPSVVEYQVWSSDGSAAGTTIVDPARQFIQPGGFVASGNRMYFLGDATGVGRTLWVTDGTSAGTMRLPLNIAAGPGSNIGPIVKLGSNLYFSANDGVNGQELWKSDGTAGGTSMLLDIQPGAGSSHPSELLVHNGALYFTAQGRLWKSDGTPGGSAPVSTTVMSPQKLTSVGSTLYFVGSDSAGQELWKSDGTSTGTVRVADVRTGGASSSIDLLTNVNGTLFFIADNGATGQELFKSDGSAAGTVLVRDIVPGTQSSGPALLTNVNGTLFFRAGDGTHGWELWKSDGSGAGTTMVKDIRAGTADSVVHLITAVGSTAYFVADDGVHGQEIWKSDGTSAGTVMVTDIAAGAHGSSPTNLIEINGQLAFRANDAVNGPLLWKSDGSAAGTEIVKSAAVNGPGYDPLRLTNINGKLVFTARGGAYQTLWVSDLTSGGTKDMFIQGNIFGPPRAVTELNGELFFAATTSANGTEFWKIALPLESATVAAPATAPALTAPALDFSSPATGIAPDVFYDGSVRPEKPSYVGSSGMAGILVTHGAWTEPELVFPEEAGIRAQALQAAAKNQPLVFDIEHLKIDNRNTPEAVLQVNLEKLMQVVDWAHAAAPGLQVGFYGLMPVDVYPAPAPGTSSWRAATERLRPLIDRVDTLFSVIYTFNPWHNEVWRVGAENMIAEARTFEKPVVPFLWPTYFFNPDLGKRLIPPDVWRMQLDTVHTYADGAIIWDAGSAWQDRHPHWMVTRDFLIDPTPIAPATPSNLGAAVQSAQRINLNWTDKSYNESGWRVQRRLGASGPFVTVAALNAGATTYADTSVSAASSYTYRVVAFNSGGESLPSNEVTVTTPAGNVAPAAPVNPGAAGIAPAVIRVSWIAGSQNHTGFRIERAAVGGSFAPIGTAAADASSFDDTTAAAGTQYRYRIRAYNAFGDSAYSAEVNAMTVSSTKDPRAIWKLDDATGTTAADASGAGRNGTVVGGAAWSSGTLGGALLFDGVDDRVAVADAPELRFTAAQDFMISAWVNLTSLPNQRVGVVTKAGTGIFIDAANQWTFGGAGGDLNGPVAATGWTHVAIVQDGAAGTRKLYVNGVEAASGVAHSASAAGDLWIGGVAGATEFFAGKVDDVRVYGKAWSADEVAALANPRVTLSGTGGNDTFVVEIDALTDRYRFIVNGTTIATPLRDAIASIDVLGNAGDDQLTIDSSGGNALPDYGITFDGGGGRDTLKIAGNQPNSPYVASATQVTRGAGTGTGAGAGAITHSNIEALTLVGASMTITANLGIDFQAEAGAIATFAAAQKLTALIAAGGQIDVGAHNVAIDYTGNSPIGGITSALFTGRNFGHWNGNGIITSSAAAKSPALLTTLVPVEASSFLNISGEQTATWFGMTVDATTVLLVYAWAGDANFDGVVDADDYFLIDSGFSSQSGGYANGDFDFSGAIDADDYFLIDKNYGKGGTLPTAPPASSSAYFGPAPVEFAPDDESAYDLLADDPAGGI